MFISTTEKNAICENLIKQSRQIERLNVTIWQMTERLNTLEAFLPKPKPPKLSSDERKLKQREYARKYYAAKKLAQDGQTTTVN